ncbi:U-box domain-containing protein 4 [Tanacetum coccineum]
MIRSGHQIYISISDCAALSRHYLYIIVYYVSSFDSSFALEPIVGFLQSNNMEMQEHAVAAIVTLSASPVKNRVYLKSVNRTRLSLTSEEGVLVVVKVLEIGSIQGREHAIGTLLTMCQSDRCRYREPILKEGVIPGTLELTVQGTTKSITKGHTLLRLLCESPYQRTELEADTLESILSNIITQTDGKEQCGNAKKMLVNGAGKHPQQHLQNNHATSIVLKHPQQQ